MVTEYLVVLHEYGHDETVRKYSFKEAVQTYRTLTEIYGSQVQIFQKVVDYGEAI